VTLVTGAASGIGRALCAALGREGAHLGLLDRNAEGLATVARELETAGVRCAHATADVTDRIGVQAAITYLSEQLGPVDILVACAGITGATLVDELAIEDTAALINVNLLGVAYSINAVLPGMLDRGQGQIVGISSIAGWRGMPYSAAYSASKAAVARYLESLRPALRRRGIAVSTIFPGFVNTPLMAAARARPPLPMMEPEQAARHILKAIRRRSRVYAFPWSTCLVAGFLRWLPPAVFDWLMGRAAAQIPGVQY
jgi:short-subunit dehydrogenase